MKVTTIRTEKITPFKISLFEVLDRNLKDFKEESVLAITSKIVSICEGRVVKIGKEDKNSLIKKEADWYLPRSLSKYNFILTIKNNILLPSAGIDESNSNGHFVMWPKDPQKTANQVRDYLINRFNLKKAGVIITDSKTTPLRWGTGGVAIAHSGFKGLNNYIGKPDIFGRTLLVTQANIMDALAVAAVLTMGEGKEQTPLAVIEELPFVQFQQRNPTQKELKDLRIEIEDDLYAPLLTKVNWQKGG